MINLEKTILEKPYKIIDIKNNSSIKRRFLDIGIIKGATIEKILKSPFKGMCAYQIMGSTIAIRDKDAKGIIVTNEEI